VQFRLENLEFFDLVAQKSHGLPPCNNPQQSKIQNRHTTAKMKPCSIRAPVGKNKQRLWSSAYGRDVLETLGGQATALRRTSCTGNGQQNRTPSRPALRQQQDRASDESVKAKMVQTEESLHRLKETKREQPLAEKSPMQGTGMSRTAPSRQEKQIEKSILKQNLGAVKLNTKRGRPFC
jgi:hypothetical protein